MQSQFAAIENSSKRATPISTNGALRSDSLVKIYSKRTVVNCVSIEVRQGEIVGLLGPNGAGKTTTFYMITGMVRPSDGRIFLGEIDITNLPMYKRARLGVGYLSQEPSIFRRLTVEQNILAILETLPLSSAERRRRLEELLDELNIAHLAKNLAYTLSGGERRRVEITRALVTKPKFI
jgi:lipopolysaccharide export system ATP-binding protein